MDWLASNWIWLALVIGMIAMHAFGHGHGGHRHQRRTQEDDGEARQAHAPSTAINAPNASDQNQGHRRHRHGC
jgi:hypothetical protein